MPSPFTCMSIVNILAGLFSTLAGVKKAMGPQTPRPMGKPAINSNPWLYVIGGTLTVLVGIGNGFQWSLATWGTILFICTSLYDGWWGPGRQDFRFYTLNSYAILQAGFVLWSTQVKSLFLLS